MDINKMYGIIPKRVCTVRRFGHYVNTIEDSDEAVRAFILKNVPPLNFTETGKIPETISFFRLLQIAKKQNYTFEKTLKY